VDEVDERPPGLAGTGRTHSEPDVGHRTETIKTDS
jgi:hypothetical protein